MSGLQISGIILAVTLGLFNFFLCVSVLGAATEKRRAVEKRVNALSRLKIVQVRKNKRRESVLRRAKGLDTAGGGRGKKIMDRLFDELIGADIMMRPEEFGMIWIVLTFVPAGLAALFGAGILPAATLAALGASLPIVFIRVKKDKRTKIFEGQLGDTLIMICNSLRSGFSFQQAMESVATDMPAPMGVEFTRVCNEIRYGATLDQALENMSKRMK